MKTLFSMMVVITVVVFASCNKENSEYKSIGTIIGLDNRPCMCCGGWIIEIDGHDYQFNFLPDSSINLKKEKFPITVKLDWKMNTIGCTNTITIERIKKY